MSIKARDLAEQLLKHPEFEVKAVYLHDSPCGWGIAMDQFDVMKLVDIGFSDGVAVLDLECAIDDEDEE